MSYIYETFMFIGWSVSVGQIDSGPHPQFLVLRIFYYAVSRWPVGRAVRC